MRKNEKIADLLFKIADMLEFKGVNWEPRAYRKAASSVQNLSEDIMDLWEKGGKESLKSIPGIGDSIATSIENYLTTGKMDKYDKLREDVPIGVHQIMGIQGIGPKKAKKLFDELQIESVEDLEKAVKAHKIRVLDGFGEKSEQNIMKGLKMSKEGQERTTLDKRLDLAESIVSTLKELNEVSNIAIAGSLRRMRETIGDVDILVSATDVDAVMDAFTTLSDVKRVLGKGITKSSIILDPDIQIDLRILDANSWGSGLLYFTGSKDHNIALRKVAIKNNYKLSEYGLFKDKQTIASKTEEEIYNALDMQWVPPELREDRGEVEAALDHSLPNLIGYDDLKGDFHVHTTYSDGSNTIEEMVQASIEREYEYICISDHSKSEKIAGGLTEHEIIEQLEKIRTIDDEFSDIKVLAGVEVSVLKDGSLDFSDDILQQFDVVVAGIHSHFSLDKDEMTARILHVLEQNHVNILTHPTGRIIHKRAAYDANWKEIFTKAKNNNVYMGINSHPSRLDLNDTMIKEAKEIGAKFSINSDAHSTQALSFVKYGIATARRGWLKKDDVLNTRSLKDLPKMLKNLNI